MVCHVSRNRHGEMGGGRVANLPVRDDTAGAFYDGDLRHVVVRLEVRLYHQVAEACRQQAVRVAVAPVQGLPHLHRIHLVIS